MAGSRIHRGMYNCPNCGAGASPEDVRCAYCNSGLATKVCPACLGAVANGMDHCPSCGATISAARPTDKAGSKCPRCAAEFMLLPLGPGNLRECPVCGGLWVDPATFEQICADHEQQEAVMSVELPPPLPDETEPHKPQRTYVPCPDCGKLMNRRHFACCSGIVVDWCKDHGTWFDRDELKQVVQFIRGGGLKKSRQVEKARLEEQRIHLKEEQRNLRRISRIAGEASSFHSQFNSGHDLLEALMETWAKSRR